MAMIGSADGSRPETSASASAVEETGGSSMWKQRSRPSLRRSPVPESTEVSFDMRVRYCQMYTKEWEAATT